RRAKMDDNVNYTGRQEHEVTAQPIRDEFDKVLYRLLGLPGSVHTRESTLTIADRECATTETFIIQTYRQPEIGDMIFLQRVNREGTVRMVIPAKVADVISRQRDQLSKKIRSKVAKQTMQARKDRGEIVGFQKKNA